MQNHRHAIVIHSPHSGRSTQLSETLSYLQQAGVEVARTISIAELDGLPPQGTTWREQGIDIAIAAGGDGVVGGVITHIAASGLPLGIMPLGTANDIARSLRIPQDLHQAAEVIALGHEQGIDIGVAQPAEQALHQASRTQHGPVPYHVALQHYAYFAHVLTVGLNVEFARIATNVATRKRFGRLTYPVAAIEVLRNHEALDVELHFDGLFLPPKHGFMHRNTTPVHIVEDEATTLRSHALQVTVINAPIFGGRWQLGIPGVSLIDRLLDIVVIEEREAGDLNTRLAHFFGRKEKEQQAAAHEQEQYGTRHPAELTGIPGIHHVQARSVTITTDADPRDVTLDGEVRGQTPMHTRVADERLRVLVP